MKKILHFRVLFALILAIAPLGANATPFSWSDNFTTGSSINSSTPSAPTANSTSYETICSMFPSWLTNTVSPNDLRFGVTNTAGGNICELQALFSTNALALTAPGDYIRLTVVFTNTAGIFCSTAGGALTQVGFGLYSSGQVMPFAGGYYNQGNGQTLTGYAQNWKGYVAQVSPNSGLRYQIVTRPTQTDSLDDNQDLTSAGSGTKSFHTPAGTVVKIGDYSTVAATTNQVYTEVFTIAYLNSTTLLLTNALYTNSTGTGTPMTFTNGVAPGTTNIVNSFDAFAIGFYKKADTSDSNVLDIASISISGSATPVSGPPTITVQPTNTLVASNGACAFIANASGISVTYQWHRNGTNINAGGNISIVNSSDGTSSLLAIANAGSADALSAANGYYVTVSGTGNFSTNSITNSLTLIPVTNLFYATGPWDVETSSSWDTSDTGTPNFVFDFGDPVTFGDNGGGTVTLSGSYLSASSVTVSQSAAFLTWSGNGSFAGPGSLLYSGSATFTVNNANTFTGGTIISNAAANLKLGNPLGLGTGPANLVAGQIELLAGASGSASIIPNDIIVASNFTCVVDVTNTSFGAQFSGNLSGTSGQTLTIKHSPVLGNGTNGPWTAPFTRIRASGNSTVYNANLVLGISGDTNFLWACYQTSNQTYNGVISGPGSYMQKAGITYLNGPNTYAGSTTPAAGAIGLGVDTTGSPGAPTSGPIGTGVLFLFADSTSASPSASAQVFASGGARTIANAIKYFSTTNDLQLIVGGTNNLTFTGPVSLNGLDGFAPAIYTNRTFQITNTAATTLAGAIGDNSAGYGLIRSGPGPLYLNGNNTYSGLTLNTNNSPTNGIGLLAGSGTIAGSVLVQTNSAIGGGAAAAIGTLTVSGNLTNKGNVFVRVNRSLSPAQSNDMVSVTGALTNASAGTVTVTNLGTALVAGNKLYVFNKAMSNGSTMTVTGGLSGGFTWSNGLAVDGSISVVVQQADVSVLKTGPASVSVGTTTNYTLTVSNAGPNIATGMMVTDTMPASVTFVSASNGGATNTTANPKLVIWSGFNLAANTGTNFTLSVVAAAIGNATNTATVVSALTDPNTANNSATNVMSITSSSIIPTVPAHISTFSLVGANVQIGGTNGVNGGTYYLLDSTDAAKPFGQWLSASTNVVTASGGSASFTFTGTNVVTPNGAQQFYILSNTNNH